MLNAIQVHPVDTVDTAGSHGITATIERWIHQLRAARDRNAARTQLRRLPPRLLSDIGIEPHQISAVADGLAAARDAGRSRTGRRAV